MKAMKIEVLNTPEEIGLRAKELVTGGIKKKTIFYYVRPREEVLP